MLPRNILCVWHHGVFLHFIMSNISSRPVSVVCITTPIVRHNLLLCRRGPWRLRFDCFRGLLRHVKAAHSDQVSKVICSLAKGKTLFQCDDQCSTFQDPEHFVYELQMSFLPFQEDDNVIDFHDCMLALNQRQYDALCMLERCRDIFQSKRRSCVHEKAMLHARCGFVNDFVVHFKCQ